MGENESEMDFTSFVASELKELFDEKFNNYKNQLGKMQDIAPQKISKAIDQTILNFFSQLEEQIRTLETDTLSRLSQSSTLTDLTSFLHQTRPSFGLDHSPLYTKSKQQLDTQISQGAFTQIVQSKDTYES